MTTRRARPTQSLDRQMEDLGLTPQQAKLLVALLQSGTANSARLAELSGVHRKTIYRVMDALTEAGLVAPVPVDGPVIWTSLGWDAVIDTLDQAALRRLHLHRARISQLRDTLAQTRPGRVAASV